MVIIPIVSSLCYLIGGQWWKPARWFMGVPIAIIALLTGHGWTAILAIPAYWIATSAFPYGENSWLNFLGEWGKFAVCGLVFGLASIPVLGLYGVIQGIVSMCAFLCIKYFDDKGIMKNPFVELARGALGCAVYVFI